MTTKHIKSDNLSVDSNPNPSGVWSFGGKSGTVRQLSGDEGRRVSHSDVDKQKRRSFIKRVSEVFKHVRKPSRGTLPINEQTTEIDSVQQLLLDTASCDAPQLVKHILISKKSSLNKKTISDVMFAVCKLNYPDVAKELILANTDIEAQDDEKMTPLMRAAWYDSTEMIQFLVEQKANLEATDWLGKTALIWASMQGNIESVKKLLELKADISAKCDNKCAIQWAGPDGHADVVKALLNAKSHTEIKDERGRTPLIMAAGAGRTEVVNVLLDAKAFINAQMDSGSGKGETALMQACYRGRKEIVEILLRHKADLETTDAVGKTAEDHAKKNPEIEKLLHNHHIIDSQQEEEQPQSFMGVGTFVPK